MTKRINHHTVTFYTFPEVWEKFNKALRERGISKNFVFRQLIALIGFMKDEEVESLFSLFSNLIKEHDLEKYIVNIPTSSTRHPKKSVSE